MTLPERLRAHAAHQIGDDFRTCREAADEIERLQADALRYRWLRDNFSPMGLNIDGNHAWVYRRNFTLKGPNLDAAIDGAMAEKHS